jgi:hypothetical protein
VKIPCALLQVYTCQEISGHWFTYTLTTMTLAMVFVHIRGNDLPGLSVWYAAWIVLYQVLTLRVLKFTQHFFHDSGMINYTTPRPQWLSCYIRGRGNKSRQCR